MDKEPLEILTKIDPDYSELSGSQKAQLEDLLSAMRIVHKKATSEDREGFNGTDVINLNRDVVMKDYMLNPHQYGKLRKNKIQIVSTIDGKRRISSVTPADPKDLPELFDEFSKNLSTKTAIIDEDSPVERVLDTAAWAHFELIRLHPFIDGNGRTARLLVDFIFSRANLPYITDWGSDNREYIETVYETHAEMHPGILKRFLAKKLLLSVGDLEKDFQSSKEVTKNIRDELNDFLINYPTNKQ